VIVAEQKPFEEIEKSLAGYGRVVIASCGTCATVCMAGGEKEALVLRALLAGKDVSVVNCKRQCDHEFIDDLADDLLDGDVILSLACGVGVQFLSEKFAGRLVLPGLNTLFYGAARGFAHWTEYCQGCGSCMLEATCGVCPVSRCSKSNFNGPCGGSQGGKCELEASSSIDCAWQLIYDRAKAFGRLDNLADIAEPRDWRSSRDGGVRSLRRADLIVEGQQI